MGAMATTTLSMDGIADRIKQRRLELVMSCQQLARLVGVCQSAVWCWEAGSRTPRMDNIQKLARALECQPFWLAYGIDDPQEGGPDGDQA